MNTTPNMLIENHQEVVDLTTDTDVGRLALHDIHAPHTEWSEAHQGETEAAMQQQMETLGKHVPEITAEAERITKGAAQLVETFQVQPEFFSEKNRSMIFASLALATARNQEQSEQGNVDRRELERERSFITDAAFLLTRNHATAYPELVAEHARQNSEGHDTSQMRARINKYVQPELTAELNKRIEDSGMLDKLRDYLGQGEEEPDFQALGVGGEIPAMPFSVKGNDVTIAERHEWEKGLIERSKRFAAEVSGGDMAIKAAGFDIELDGHHHVYIPMANVEALLAKERGIVLSDDRIAERVAATIKHEYVHTQGGVNVEDEFGRSLEERRAEYFSGDRSEYYDVKRFFNQLNILHGSFIGDMFEESVDSRHTGDEISIYELVARDYGLESVAEVAAASPGPYVRFAKSEFSRDLAASVGGFDAVIARAVERGNIDVEAAKVRLADRVNTLRAIHATEEGPDLEFESFISASVEPVLNSLNVRLADIPYVPPKTEAA